MIAPNTLPPARELLLANALAGDLPNLWRRARSDFGENIVGIVYDDGPAGRAYAAGHGLPRDPCGIHVRPLESYRQMYQAVMGATPEWRVAALSSEAMRLAAVFGDGISHVWIVPAPRDGDDSLDLSEAPAEDGFARLEVPWRAPEREPQAPVPELVGRHGRAIYEAARREVPQRYGCCASAARATVAMLAKNGYQSTVAAGLVLTIDDVRFDGLRAQANQRFAGDGLAATRWLRQRQVERGVWCLGQTVHTVAVALAGDEAWLIDASLPDCTRPHWGLSPGPRAVHLDGPVVVREGRWTLAWRDGATGAPLRLTAARLRSLTT